MGTMMICSTKDIAWISGRAALHAILNHGATPYVHSPQAGMVETSTPEAKRRAAFWSQSVEAYKSPFYVRADAVSREQHCACCW